MGLLWSLEHDEFSMNLVNDGLDQLLTSCGSCAGIFLLAVPGTAQRTDFVFPCAAVVLAQETHLHGPGPKQILMFCTGVWDI